MFTDIILYNVRICIHMCAKPARKLTEHDSKSGLPRAQRMVLNFNAVQHDARVGLFSRRETLQ